MARLQLIGLNVTMTSSEFFQNLRHAPNLIATASGV